MHHTTIMDTVGRNDSGVDYGRTKYERLKDKYGDKLEFKARSRKHRYFMFLGNKKQVKEMRASLTYKTEPYPKGDNERYDATYEPKTQGILF